MPRPYKIFGFLFVVLLGVYGCAKGPGAPESASNNTKAQKIEEDYRAAIAARDQFRLKLAAAEEQQAQTRRELEKTTKERDTLKADVQARTAERDALQVQYEGFRTRLKELLGNADTAVGKLNLPPPLPPAELEASRN
jgi:septal ring factor EnvC (AmiA/AmiB activator)